MSSHFASSVLEACLRCELRPSLVHPLASTWCGIRIYGSSGVIHSVGVAVALQPNSGSFDMIWEEFAYPSHEAGLIYRLPPIWPAVQCECIEGSRLSAVIELCRSLWRPLAAAAEGAEAHLPASQSVSARGVTQRSAPSQECGLALLTWLTCPHLDGRPPTAVGRVSSPRGSHIASCRGKIPSRIFECRYAILGYPAGCYSQHNTQCCTIRNTYYLYYVLSIRIIHNTRDGQIWNTRGNIIIHFYTYIKTASRAR